MDKYRSSKCISLICVTVPFLLFSAVKFWVNVFLGFSCIKNKDLVTRWHQLNKQPLLKVHHFSLNLQVDEAIQPGLISLNWTSLNIDKYLDRIDKALGKPNIQAQHLASQHWQTLMRFTCIHSLFKVHWCILANNSHTVYVSFLFYTFLLRFWSLIMSFHFFPPTLVITTLTCSGPGAADGQGEWLGGVQDRRGAARDEWIHSVHLARGWTRHLWGVCSHHQGKWIDR